MDKEAILELYDAAKDKDEQIKCMVSMGFGSRYQIVQLLHENDRALDIKIVKPGPKPKEKPEEKDPEEAAGENPQKDKTPEHLPMPLDVRQYLLDGLDDIDARIKEIQEIIDAKTQEKRRLENLYKHIVDCIGQHNLF